MHSLSWSWEFDPLFDTEILEASKIALTEHSINWIDFQGNPVQASKGVTVSEKAFASMINGQSLGDPSTVIFRDPASFHAGEVHAHAHFWEKILGPSPTDQQAEVLDWIRNKVSLFLYFQPFRGTFKGTAYDSARPPASYYPNNRSCCSFAAFVRKTLIERVRNGAISLIGRIGQVTVPHLVHPLTVEPGKPRLCYDARFLNLWIKDSPFKLDRLADVPRYVTRGSYQTVIDDKSGYDHILLTTESRQFFGIQWGGWLFVHNSFPFGWKTSPYIYHTTGLAASSYFRSIKVPCSLYIDDRHNGELSVPLNEGAYVALSDVNGRHIAAANSALFLVVYTLVLLGYFLNLSKSVLVPRLIVPYLGFLVNSADEVFQMIPHKKVKFLSLLDDILKQRTITIKTLQKLVGKCVSFPLAIPAAILFTREMNLAISAAQRTGRPIYLRGPLREEISRWSFVRTWSQPLPWREEKHIRVSISSDASASGWGGHITSPVQLSVSDYWSPDEKEGHISVKEAVALERLLLASRTVLENARVDALVDNQAVVNSWNNKGGHSAPLNRAIKSLFSTTVRLNLDLRILYVASQDNPADAPSRRLSSSDCQLDSALWDTVQRFFGGLTGHSCDLMALDSNAMRDLNGNLLPHFTPWPSPASVGVNFFAQVSSRDDVSLPIVGPVLRHLQACNLSCTFVTLDVYPRKYWWPVLQSYTTRAIKLAQRGDPGGLRLPSPRGWVPHPGIPGDLWVFALDIVSNSTV